MCIAATRSLALLSAIGWAILIWVKPDPYRAKVSHSIYLVGSIIIKSPGTHHPKWLSKYMTKNNLTLSKPSIIRNCNEHQNTSKTNSLKGFRGTMICITHLSSVSQTTPQNCSNRIWDLSRPVKLFISAKRKAEAPGFERFQNRPSTSPLHEAWRLGLEAWNLGLYTAPAALATGIARLRRAY